MIYAILIYNASFMIINASYAFITGCGLRFANEGTSFYELFTRPFFGIFACNYMGNPWTNPLVGQFWFVWVLIMMKFIFRYLRDLSDKNLLLLCLGCLIVVMFLNFTGLRTLYYVDRVILALPFFIVGQLCRRNNKIVSNYILNGGGKILVFNVLIVAVSALYYFFLTENRRPDMFHFNIGHSAILYYIVAFAGTSLLVQFSKKMKYNKYIVAISNGTFFILATHLFLQRIDIIPYDITKILFLLILLIVSYPFIQYFDHHLPIMLGKRKR